MKTVKDRQVNTNYDQPEKSDCQKSVDLSEKDEADKRKEKFFSDLMALF